MAPLYNPVHGVDRDNLVAWCRETLAKARTLSNKATILKNISPAGRMIETHFDDLEFMDHACIELIDNWQKQYVGTGGHVHINWDTAISKYHEKNGRRAVFA